MPHVFEAHSLTDSTAVAPARGITKLRKAEPEVYKWLECRTMSVYK